MSSSSNNRRRSLSSDSRHHRSRNRIQYLPLSNTDSSSNGSSSTAEQRSTALTNQMLNQLQQLQINSDINIRSTHPATAAGNSTGVSCDESSESLAEEELIDRLKEMINEFMTRPGRRYSYNTTMRWTVDHGNQINYSVVILINQPSDLI